jgi:hypothetical protein
MIKQQVFTKVIKNAKQKSWIERPSRLIKIGEEAQMFKVEKLDLGIE